MTLAICWKCGAQKIGAFTPCATCAEEPRSTHDQAVSLLLTDHYRDETALAEAADAIGRGEPVAFQPGEVEEAERVVALAPSMPRGCLVVTWIPVVLLIVLAAVVAVLAFGGAYDG